ncbi:MAG: lasso peptide biosynthesis B2 protein [Hyphomonadaceae bacterium]|nr:lasso peptide biosynthesis B2 protein [Hyphomonadaceae bacterium]MBY0565147.1 lasso peptide biosynthesis B2 protein [Hyphomonadaceae bacterium]
MKKTAKRLLLVGEALIFALIAFMRVRLTPYRRWRYQMGEVLPLDAAQHAMVMDEQSAAPVADVVWAHQILSRRFKGMFTCLMLALSARAMLERRRLPHVLVLGVRRGREKLSLDAHAWVLSSGIEIVGREGRADHIPVAVYGSNDNQ